MSRWTKMSKEELLEIIRKEIIEINIEDYPSQTRYTEKSRREFSPSATAAKKRLGMTWVEIVDSLGFNYSQKKHTILKERSSKPRAKRTKPSPLKGRKVGSKWTRIDRVELAKKIKKAIRENNIETIDDYRNFRASNKEEYPTYSFIHYYFGNLKEIKNKDVRRW